MFDLPTHDMVCAVEGQASPLALPTGDGSVFQSMAMAVVESVIRPRESTAESTTAGVTGASSESGWMTTAAGNDSARTLTMFISNGICTRAGRSRATSTE